MFRTWRIRQRNPVWVCKLADIVTSLWLGIIVLPKELFKVIHVCGNLFNDIIFGINESVRGKQVVGFLLTWGLLRSQLQQQMTDKYNRFQVVTLHSSIFQFFHNGWHWYSIEMSIFCWFSFPKFQLVQFSPSPILGSVTTLMCGYA